MLSREEIVTEKLSPSFTDLFRTPDPERKYTLHPDVPVVRGLFQGPMHFPACLGTSEMVANYLEGETRGA